MTETIEKLETAHSKLDEAEDALGDDEQYEALSHIYHAIDNARKAAQDIDYGVWFAHKSKDVRTTSTHLRQSDIDDKKTEIVTLITDVRKLIEKTQTQVQTNPTD